MEISYDNTKDHMVKKYIEYENGTRVDLDKHDVPELTDHFFEHAKSFKDVLPDVHTAWKRSRERSKLEHPKDHPIL